MIDLNPYPPVVEMLYSNLKHQEMAANAEAKEEESA